MSHRRLCRGLGVWAQVAVVVARYDNVGCGYSCSGVVSVQGTRGEIAQCYGVGCL